MIGFMVYPIKYITENALPPASSLIVGCEQVITEKNMS
jgi:hypothetical protein